MAELRRIDAPLSPFEEARQWIAKWEKEEPTMERIVLVGDLPAALVLSVTGDPIKPSAVAGLCLAAAQIALE